MPRRLLGVFMLLLVSVLMGRAQGDVVLLTVGNEMVSKHEFEYFFSKSQEKRADVFAETYAHFKKKVQYARELGLDTLAGFRFRMEQLKEKAEAKKTITRSRKAEKEWIKLWHVTWPLKQKAAKHEELRGKRYLDSLYREWKEHQTVPEMLQELPWVEIRYLLDEWRIRLGQLNRNELSEPFFSPLGIHLIAWKDKFTGRNLPEGKGKDTDRFREKEMEESLLTIALEEYLQGTVTCSERELDTYFKANHAVYGGGTPHFKGALIHARHKKVAKAVKKYLRQYPEVLWHEAVKRMPEELSGECRVQVALFPIGTNPFVDKLAFNCGSFTSLADYPYVCLVGKRLKKGPTDYREVRQELVKDCLKDKKMAQIEGFTQKYAVEINKEVLKTVNRAENK